MDSNGVPSAVIAQELGDHPATRQKIILAIVSYMRLLPFLTFSCLALRFLKFFLKKSKKSLKINNQSGLHGRMQDRPGTN